MAVGLIDCVNVGDCDCVTEGVWVSDWLGVAEALAVRVCVSVGVPDCVSEGVCDCVCDGLCVPEGVTETEGVCVRLALLLCVSVRLPVWDWLAVVVALGLWL